jgi:hypothetical protein
LLKSIDTYKKKFEPTDGQPKKKKRHPTEIRIDNLRNTFSSNILGFKVNGRPLREPEPAVMSKI